MMTHKEDSIQGIRMREAQEELAGTDYRVIKAMEEIARERIEQMYPGETERRERLRARIRELRGG